MKASKLLANHEIKYLLENCSVGQYERHFHSWEVETGQYIASIEAGDLWIKREGTTGKRLVEGIQRTYVLSV